MPAPRPVARFTRRRKVAAPVAFSILSSLFSLLPASADEFDIRTGGRLIVNTGATVFARGGFTLGDGTAASPVGSGGGTLEMSGGTLEVQGDFDSSGGSEAITGGTLLLTGSTAGSIYTAAGHNLWNFTVSASSTKTAANALNLDGSVTLATGTFAAGAFTHTVAANWTNSATFTPGSSTITFDGAVNQVLITGGTGAGKAFNNLTIANTGDDTGEAVTNDITLTTNALDVNGSLSITDGDLAASGLNVTVGGNWSNTSGDGGFIPGGAAQTVTFDGAADQSLTSGGTGSQKQFQNLVIANTGTGTDNDVSLLANNVAVLGDLTINDGDVEANALDIQLFGDWINNNAGDNGGFVGGSGTVIFRGSSAAQSIEGTASTTFNKVQVLKPGSPALTLNTSATASGTTAVDQGSFVIAPAKTYTANDDLTVGKGSGLGVGGPETAKLDVSSTAGGVAQVTVGDRKSLTVNPAGTLLLAGVAAGNQGTITSGGGFRLAVKGAIDATNFSIANLGNRTLGSTTTTTAETASSPVVTLTALPSGTLAGHYLVIEGGGNAAGSPYLIMNVTGTTLTLGKAVSTTTSGNTVRVVEAGGLEIWRGATIAALGSGTLSSNASGNEHRAPLLNFAPTPTEANWPDGGDRDKIPRYLSGLTFTGQFPSTSPEDDFNYAGDVNVRAGYKTPVVRFVNYAGNLTRTTDTTGQGTQAGGERNEFDLHDRVHWDRAASEDSGVAKNSDTGVYYDTLQAALDAASSGHTLVAATQSPISENLRHTSATKDVTLQGFVLSPKSGYAVEDTADGGGQITLRNTVVASGGVKGFDSGDDAVICENCTIFQHGPSFTDEFSGTTLDGGTWAQTQSPTGGSVTVGSDSWPSGVVRRIALVQDTASEQFPVVDSVQNPFPAAGTAFYFEVRFKYDTAAAAAGEIKLFTGGGENGTRVLRITTAADGGVDVYVGPDATPERDGASNETGAAHIVKLCYDGSGSYALWFDAAVDDPPTATVALAATPDFITLGNTGAAAAAWADLDIDWMRVTPVPPVVNASLSRTIQEVADSGTTALSGNNLNLRRANARQRLPLATESVARPIFADTSRFDYHLNPVPFPGQASPAATSAPAWYPIDRVSAPTYNTEFDDNTGVTPPHRPFDAPGTYAGSEASGTCDIGADEYRTNSGFDVAPKFTWGGSGDEDGTGPVKSFTFVGGRDGEGGAGSDGYVYAYYVTAGGGSDPAQDNTLRLFQVTGSTPNTEITTAANRLQAPGQVIFLTYIHQGINDIRIYCVIDYDKDGRGDSIWAAQDLGVNSGTIFQVLATFDDGGGQFSSAGFNNFGDTGNPNNSDFDNTPAAGVRWYGPGRIYNVVALQVPGLSAGESPRRLFFACESDGRQPDGSNVPGTAHANAYYCVDADDGTTLWVESSVVWHWKSFPSLFPPPIMAGGALYAGMSAGAAGGNDMIKMTGIGNAIVTTQAPVAAPAVSTGAAAGVPAADGISLDINNNYIASASTIYAASGNTSRIYRFTAALAADTAWANDTDSDGDVDGADAPGVSVRLDPAAANPASTNSPVQVIWGGVFYYVSAGNNLYRVRESDGRKRSSDAIGTAGYLDSSDWPLPLRGPMSTFMLSTFSNSAGGWLNYFGTEAGECFAVQDNDWDDGQAGYDGKSGVLPGWPYIVPGQRIIDVRSLWGTTYFVTDQGQIYGFPQQ